MTQIQCLLR